jgi:molybdenum cofactor synthesis domain-containing protein
MSDPLVPLEEAQAHVIGSVGVLPAMATPVAEALGRVLAEDVVATEPLPPFANTAMDGYAVRAVDTSGAPVDLRVIGTLAAGAAPSVAVGPGQAVRIMTGAPIPPGADAVVMVEHTTAGEDGLVSILEPASNGDHVRPAGEDVSPGQTVFTAGDVLGPGHLGVLASLGLNVVAAVRHARVGVLSTGDELTEGGAPLEPGQIRDANRRSLLALVALAGCEPVDLGIVRDDRAALTAAVSGAVARCDALLTSGGVSVGDFDYVKVVLDELSEGSMRWMQVAIRPAKPFAFGTVAGVPVFGLPGNPVSSMVSFECFARPALRKMTGHRLLGRPTVRAVADEALDRRRDGKLVFQRVVAAWSEADGRCHVRSSGGQGSNLLRSMALANALALVPDGSGVPAEADVDVWLLDDLG